jgi:hypothetical protein
MSERQRDLNAITQAAVDAIGPLLGAALKRVATLESEVRAMAAHIERLAPQRGEPGPRGETGRNGNDGHDATFREPTDYEVGRTYAFGAIVRHRGGLWHAHRSTEAAPEGDRSGWTLVTQGIAAIAVAQAADTRTFAVAIELSSGEVVTHEFKVPALVYRGVHVDGNAYEAGDATTYQGSLWIARKATEKRPGENMSRDDWQLAVKKGHDGKPGADGKSAPEFCGFYDPAAQYAANSLVRTSSGLWLSTRPTNEPPPADAMVVESKNWRMYLPTVTH